MTFCLCVQWASPTPTTTLRSIGTQTVGTFEPWDRPTYYPSHVSRSRVPDPQHDGGRGGQFPRMQVESTANRRPAFQEEVVVTSSRFREAQIAASQQPAPARLVRWEPTRFSTSPQSLFSSPTLLCSVLLDWEKRTCVTAKGYSRLLQLHLQITHTTHASSYPYLYILWCSICTLRTLIQVLRTWYVP